MKHLLILLASFISFHTLAQPIVNYITWQEEAKKDSRLLPEYGGKPRTKEQKAKDAAYIKTTMEELHTTQEDASRQLADLGYKYYASGDMRVAMYRFNDAWVLNPKNEEAYAGFGAVYFRYEDLPNAFKYYDMGLAINPSNPNLLTDKAVALLTKYKHTFDTVILNEAVALLKKSYAVKPDHQNTTFMLARYYLGMSQCDSARKYYDACKRSGGEPITEKFTNALNERCK